MSELTAAPAIALVEDGDLLPVRKAGAAGLLKMTIAQLVAKVGAVAYTDENARDALGAALVAGAGVSITVDDAANTITIVAEVTQAELDAVAGATVTVETEAASYALVLADKGKVKRMNVAAANNLTVPTNAAVAFPVGTQIQIIQVGAGQTTIVASGGVTINTPETLKLRKQYSGVTLTKTATDTWHVIGDLERLP